MSVTTQVTAATPTVAHGRPYGLDTVGSIPMTTPSGGSILVPTVGGLTVTETGYGHKRRTVFDFVSVQVPMVSGSASTNTFGGLVIYNFPVGLINQEGTVFDLISMNRIVPGAATGVLDTATLAFGLGTTVAANTGAISSTGANFLASTAEVLVGGLGPAVTNGKALGTAFLGTATTASQLFLNIGGQTTSTATNGIDTMLVTGRCVVDWSLAGKTGQ